MTWDTNLKRFFQNKKGLILLKSKIVLSSYKFVGQNTCDSIRNYLSAQIVQSISFKRDFFFSSSSFWKGIKRPRVFCCKGFLNTRERLSLCDSDFVKGFYKESGKSQVGCLRTGCRHRKWPNQYKSSLHFSLPLNFFYLLLFIFGLKEVYFELSFE